MSEEEKSLEEFFAKREKGKKSKTKGKAFTTAKDIADKKQKVKGKAEEKTETTAKEVSQVEEQWKDFETPQELDVSGLRVMSLQRNDENEGEDEGPTYENSGEDEDEMRREAAGGPWAVSAQAQTAPGSVAEPARASVVKGKYVPGAFKEKFKKERSGVPPDISSQAAFPTLGTAAPSRAQGRGDFEMVKRGTKSSGFAADSKPSYNSENRYDSLRT